MIDFGRFEVMTFDCYGTLIDWERGILDGLLPILRMHGILDMGDENVLERFARHETRIEAEAYREYREVLAEVVRRLGEDLGFQPDRPVRNAFGASVATWPPFPDSVDALRRLKTRYRLAIVSNIDDDLFAASARTLEMDFDLVVTAQQVVGYKPRPWHFRELLKRLELPPEKIVHVAQSLYHDIAPAREFGLATVWVNRRAGRPSWGATVPSDALPDLEVPDLATLADLAV